MSNDIPHNVRVAIRARSEGVCERCRMRVATDMAHRLRRGEKERDNPGAQHSPVNIANLCRPCHEWSHSNPKPARIQGWILPANRRIRLADVGAIPAMLLDGTYVIFHAHTDSRGRLITTKTGIVGTLAIELLDLYGITDGVLA